MTSIHAALTVDELAARVGMTVRNLREWKTLGLLPAAELRGRVGYYDEAVVARVERIKQLHAEGFTLELISRMLAAGGDAGDEVVQLAAALRAPVVNTSTPRLAALRDALEDLGIAEEQALDAFGRIQELAEQMAATFEDVWMKQIWEPFLAAGMPEDELPRIQRTAAGVKPIASEIVLAVFSAAMDAQIERGIAREAGRASES
jgi:DNA-binding transcriptional MerR regulator